MMPDMVARHGALIGLSFAAVSRVRCWYRRSRGARQRKSVMHAARAQSARIVIAHVAARITGWYMPEPCPWCEGVEPFPEHFTIVCRHCGRRIPPRIPVTQQMVDDVTPKRRAFNEAAEMLPIADDDGDDLDLLAGESPELNATRDDGDPARDMFNEDNDIENVDREQLPRWGCR